MEKKIVKGKSCSTGPHFGNLYSFQIVGAELKQLFFHCENAIAVTKLTSSFNDQKEINTKLRYPSHTLHIRVLRNCCS